MEIIAYQPPLRPALPCIYGPLEYREQRALFERIDRILRVSGLEEEFIRLAARDRGVDTRGLLLEFRSCGTIHIPSNNSRVR